MDTLPVIDPGFKELPVDVMNELAHDFASQARDGAAGRDSTLPMFPAFVRQSELSGDPLSVLCLDVGGSTMRATMFRFDQDLHETVSPQEAEFTGGFMTVADYTARFADVARMAVEGHDPDVIALVYSFPARIVQTGDNIDADRSDLGPEWGKGFVIADSDINITAYMREAFSKIGISARRWVTLNDVSALMLARPGVHASFIAGTGYNIGVTDAEGDLYNTEAGFYSSPLLSEHNPALLTAFTNDIERRLLKLDVDPKTNIQLRKPSELQVGGKYLYQLLIMGLCMIGDCDHETINAISTLQTGALTSALNRDWGAFESEKLTLPEHRRNHMHELSVFLRDRAADVVAFQLAGAALFKGFSEPLQVTADGSVAHNLPGFTDRISARSTHIYKPGVKITTIERSGLSGAARAAVLTASGR